MLVFMLVIGCGSCSKGEDSSEDSAMEDSAKDTAILLEAQLRLDRLVKKSQIPEGTVINL